MPYFARMPWQNGLYEALVILLLFPLVLSLYDLPIRAWLSGKGKR